MAVVCALQPIPNQGAHTRDDLFSIAVIDQMPNAIRNWVVIGCCEHAPARRNTGCQPPCQAVQVSGNKRVCASHAAGGPETTHADGRHPGIRAVAQNRPVVVAFSVLAKG